MNGHYKDHHIEQIHSNGTTAYETFVAILPSSLMTLMTVMVDSLLCTYTAKQTKLQFIIEYMILVLPIILSITVLSKYLRSIIIALGVIVTSLVVLIYNGGPSKSLATKNEFGTSYVTNARSTINILSVIAILAVDFNVFPRYFAKTESFGYSLMDVGVGLFMYSNGIVAPETKGKTGSINKSLKASLPLFILGTARLVLIRQTDYNVAVSEYGIHWNFFITLAITKISSAVILNVIKIQHVFLTAVFIVTLHEILLQIGLQKFTMMDARRDNFIVANKEGIVSTLGYISIYLFSVYFGYLHMKYKNKNKTWISLTFIIFSLVSLIISIILQNYFGISRKLANSAYCFWVLFIGIFMTCLYYLSQVLLECLYDYKLESIYSPLIFEAINYNGLIFFLLGNLLTGVINMTFNTLAIGNHLSLAILSLYMFVNCLIVTLLYYKQYKLKF